MKMCEFSEFWGPGTEGGHPVYKAISLQKVSLFDWFWNARKVLEKIVLREFFRFVVDESIFSDPEGPRNTAVLG